MLYPIPRYLVLRVILSLETFLDINVRRPEGLLKQSMRPYTKIKILPLTGIPPKISRSGHT